MWRDQVNDVLKAFSFAAWISHALCIVEIDDDVKSEIEKWPRKFEQAYKWGICYLLIDSTGHKSGAENDKKNESNTLSGVQGQSDD